MFAYTVYGDISTNIFLSSVVDTIQNNSNLTF